MGRKVWGEPVKADPFRNATPARRFDLAHGLSVWRPAVNSTEQVIGEGLSSLRQKARQYGVI